MTIEIREGRYFSHWWFVGDDKTADWMGALWKEDKPGAVWHFDYRFRYYAGSAPDDPDDRKSWYAVTMDATKPEEEVVRSIDMIAMLNEGRFKSKMCKTVIRSNDVKKIIAAIENEPWMHVVEESTPEEVRRARRWRGRHRSST